MTTDMYAKKPRSALYMGLNLGFVLVVAVAMAMIQADHQRPLYLVLLVALCTSPILMMDRLNGRHVVLCASLAVYFLFFGATDLIALFGPGREGSAPMLTTAEMAILLGGVMLLVGYLGALSWSKQRASQGRVEDWPTNMIVVTGLVLWVIGTAAAWYWNVNVIVRRSVELNNQLSALATTAVMLGRLVQPLGILILAYGLAVSRRRSLLMLILAVVVVQVVIGFVSDSKETAMRAALLVMLVKFLVDGRLPKAWLVSGALFVTLAFPVFQAYRYEVTGQRGITNAQAFSRLGEVFRIAFEARDKVSSGFYGADARAQTFFERASLKGNIELILSRTGKDVPYQYGNTLQPLFTAFIPRLFWPNKPDIATGQLMNREFNVALEQDVYISPSFLGEMYWNFGWAGIIAGMSMFGGLLGYINLRCDLSQRSSLTRLLVISVTIYMLCVRFEGTIATSFVVWLRSLAAILALHLLLSRAGMPLPIARKSDDTGARSERQSTATLSNLMR